MFEKVLIANRGEIALRILRACREMGIKTVAVHSTADAEAMHVRLADESVCIGPPSSTDSYLNKAAVISAAMLTNADAIHPGYGFLSENADFAEMIEEHGIAFIGPTPEHIRVMGDKVAAKAAAQESGIPVVPGSDGAVETPEDAKSGGGRGMKVAESEEDVMEAFKVASGEAKSAFGNGEVYMEKYLSNPRHIEVQVLADSHGNVVHLGERDCSLQRKHQKVLEECPSPALNSGERAKIGEIVREAMKRINYRNAGTVEFLYEDGEFYFIEMNTRLQVEHPITEMVTGVDLVREQIRIASGAELDFTQDAISMAGHAIECRINAEDPVTFAPSPGKVTGYHMPGGLGVRVDSGLFAGASVPPFYDSMIAKLIVHGRNRNECLMRLKRALSEYVVEGVTTTIPLHEKLVNASDFVDGNYDIRWLEQFVLSGADN
jgi:acetyl-CoA carboxylase biotin carboxylase subunit